MQTKGQQRDTRACKSRLLPLVDSQGRENNRQTRDKTGITRHSSMSFKHCANTMQPLFNMKEYDGFLQVLSDSCNTHPACTCVTQAMWTIALAIYSMSDHVQTTSTTFLEADWKHCLLPYICVYMYACPLSIVVSGLSTFSMQVYVIHWNKVIASDMQDSQQGTC